MVVVVVATSFMAPIEHVIEFCGAYRSQTAFKVSVTPVDVLIIS